MPDKFNATWVSHSSISDWLKCPKAYYLKNIYRNPDTGNKVQLASPSLSLGQSVHEVIESLSILPVNKRFSESLLQKYEQAWKKVSGKIGGFFDEQTEANFKQRGEEMLKKVMAHPGPVGELAIKIKEDLPQYWLSEEDEIILCGKVDWLQYSPETDSVKILDFKTGAKKERADSLQLPIYLLLVTNSQSRTVAGMSYWYLGLADKPESVDLPDLAESHNTILKIAKEIKLARKLERFRCPNGEAGCPICKPFEKIVTKEAEFVGTNPTYRQDIFVLPTLQETQEEDSYII
ncbi:MAG: PD-(D/E)XK nuclease family protein [Candidatus Paceibacterota bacterium]